MSKKVKNTLRILLLSLMGAILGINIYMFNAAQVTGDAMPMPFGVAGK